MSRSSEFPGDLLVGVYGAALTDVTQLRISEAGARKLIINFEKVTYLDSSGVGELVGCYTSIRNKNGALRICGLNQRIFGLIKMTSLHSVFEVKDTEAEALAGF